MELTIINKTENEINIKVAGETHTLLNALKSVLLNNEHVEIATYDIKHPTISEPVLFVRTDGADPIEVIKKASGELVKQCDEFINLFKKKAMG
ncbi:DNA-directed RNA polymerase, subunit L [Candidatus Methanoperedens nitroreducens]|uniref:DNA-directed RNA polymerase subunit Rpo11 n=1 Tax=Candidatus Methanoperedens nitratireducens TaxID=1392998 RepID=A0A062V216_9EURY|nr:DNA-directed RNA polymerase subunit L [Candidatus Methanoperedens nitroreducens]KCZ70678.1 DNA-directed RNA polymerase, subunit L [Candidatus Methanoperedens nitroreducens]MDJ1420531.1 DNA-directed RNA polymerase subunit L [Candidatus Methanoperedens sp.]